MIDKLASMIDWGWDWSLFKCNIRDAKFLRVEYFNIPDKENPPPETFKAGFLALCKWFLQNWKHPKGLRQQVPPDMPAALITGTYLSARSDYSIWQILLSPLFALSNPKHIVSLLLHLLLLWGIGCLIGLSWEFVLKANSFPLECIALIVMGLLLFPWYCMIALRLVLIALGLLLFPLTMILKKLGYFLRIRQLAGLPFALIITPTHLIVNGVAHAISFAGSPEVRQHREFAYAQNKRFATSDEIVVQGTDRPVVLAEPGYRYETEHFMMVLGTQLRLMNSMPFTSSPYHDGLSPQEQRPELF